MMNWLSTYHELITNLDMIDFEIKRCTNEHKRWSTHGMLQGDLAKKSKTMTALTRQSELSNEIERLKLERKAIDKEIKELRQLVESFKGLDNLIMKMKYMDDMSLVEIAEELSYSYQHIKNRHAVIIKMIDYKFENA